MILQKRFNTFPAYLTGTLMRRALMRRALMTARMTRLALHNQQSLRSLRRLRRLRWLRWQKTACEERVDAHPKVAESKSPKKSKEAKSI